MPTFIGEPPNFSGEPGAFEVAPEVKDVSNACGEVRRGSLPARDPHDFDANDTAYDTPPSGPLF